MACQVCKRCLLHVVESSIECRSQATLLSGSELANQSGDNGCKHQQFIDMFFRLVYLPAKLGSE